MVISAVMAAFGITLPIVFHAVGLGSKFLPMLLPLLLNGFLSSLPWAILTGAIVPPLSGLLTGMPPLYPPVAPAMSVEAALMAAAASAIYRSTRPRIWPALAASIALGRAASVCLTWWIAREFDLPPVVVTAGYLLQGLPGIVLQVVVIPFVLKALAARKGSLFGDGGQSETGVL
jgi:hypothetical protein